MIINELMEAQIRKGAERIVALKNAERRKLKKKQREQEQRQKIVELKEK